MASKKMGALVEPPAKANKVENDYESEDHARTLTRAGEILSDPAKTKKAFKHLKKQKLAMKSTEDLRKFHQAKYGKGGTAPQDPGDIELGEE